MSSNVDEGLAYLALASSRDRLATAWVAHVFAADADRARFAAELWPMAVRK